MYQCSICGLGVLVRELETPVRACNCTQTVIIDGVEITKPATIIVKMNANLEGNSSIKG